MPSPPTARHGPNCSWTSVLVAPTGATYDRHDAVTRLTLFASMRRMFKIARCERMDRWRDGVEERSVMLEDQRWNYIVDAMRDGTLQDHYVRAGCDVAISGYCDHDHPNKNPDRYIFREEGFVACLGCVDRIKQQTI